MLLASNVAGGLYEFRQELMETLTKDNRVLPLARRRDIRIEDKKLDDVW